MSRIEFFRTLRYDSTQKYREGDLLYLAKCDTWNGPQLTNRGPGIPIGHVCRVPINPENGGDPTIGVSIMDWVDWEKI